MKVEGAAHRWRRQQGSASHLPMPCSMALGSLLCWPAAARMLMVDTRDAGEDTAPCTRLGFSLSHRDCLKLGHDTWLKVSAG